VDSEAESDRMGLDSACADPVILASVKPHLLFIEDPDASDAFVGSSLLSLVEGRAGVFA
jgi:hypothetical protein